MSDSNLPLAKIFRSQVLFKNNYIENTSSIRCIIMNYQPKFHGDLLYTVSVWIRFSARS